MTNNDTQQALEETKEQKINRLIKVLRSYAEDADVNNKYNYWRGDSGLSTALQLASNFIEQALQSQAEKDRVMDLMAQTLIDANSMMRFHVKDGSCFSRGDEIVSSYRLGDSIRNTLSEYTKLTKESGILNQMED